MSDEQRIGELTDETDGKIKLDRLEGGEKQLLITAFVESDPLDTLVLALRFHVEQTKGVQIKTLIKELKETPQYTLFWKLYNEDLIEFEHTEETFLEAVEEKLRNARKRS